MPIIVDKDGVIVAGHTRYLAAMELGMETVPTIIADDLTPKQIKAFRIADNKTAEKARWDEDLLAEEFQDLLDYDWTDFGFNEAEFLELTTDESGTELFVTNDYEKTEHVNDYDRAPRMGGALTTEEADIYAEKAENLVTKRVIIVYRTDEDEALIKAKMGLKAEEPLGVVYDIERLKGTEA